MALDKKEVLAAIKKLAKDPKTKKEMQQAIGTDGSSSIVNPKELADLKEYNDLLAKTAGALGDVDKANKARLDSAIGEFQQQIQSSQEYIDLIKKAGGETAALEEIRKHGTLALGDEGVALDANLQQIANKIKLESDLADAQKKYGSAQKKLLGDIADGLGLTTRLGNTFLGQIIDVSTAMAEGGEEGRKSALAFKENFKSIFNFTNLAMSIQTGIIEMSAKLLASLDESRAALAAATGAGYKFSDSMFEAQRNANLYGVSMDDAQKATASMVAETSRFAKFSDATQIQLVQTSAMMEKLGVDSSTAAQTFEFFNNNLGMTAAEADDARKSLAMLGNEIGISSGKILKDFQAALPTLAVYGDKAVDVFSDLAAQAKAAGVETQTLLGITKQFDTFAGAAEGAGKLNALLGTQLSTTELLMMTEDERMKTIVDAVQAQGVAFGDMDKYTQMAIAHAAGIQDMNEANRIFGASSAEYEKNKEVMDANADAQGKFEAAVAKTVPIMTKFKLLATELVVSVQPLLEILGEWADSFTTWLQSLTTGEKEFIATSLLIISTIPLVVKAFVALKAIMAAASITAPAFGAATATAITAIGTAFTTVAAELTAVASTGVGGLVLGAIWAGGLSIVQNMTIAIVAMSIAVTALATAWGFASTAESDSRAEIAKETAGMTRDAEHMLDSLEKIANADFGSAMASLSGLIQKANEFGNLDPEVSATITNLALLTIGKAKDAFSNKVVTANINQVSAKVNNIFKGMQMTIKIDDKTSLTGYIEKVAQKQVLGGD